MANFRFFQDGGRPPSWICDARVWTIHEGHLVVFITVQNLVGIDAVVSILMQVLIFCLSGVKGPIHAPRMFLPLNGRHSNETPEKAYPWAERRHIVNMIKIGPSVRPVRVRKKPKKERQRNKTVVAN